MKSKHMALFIKMSHKVNCDNLDLDQVGHMLNELTTFTTETIYIQLSSSRLDYNLIPDLRGTFVDGQILTCRQLIGPWVYG